MDDPTVRIFCLVMGVLSLGFGWSQLKSGKFSYNTRSGTRRHSNSHQRPLHYVWSTLGWFAGAAFCLGIAALPLLRRLGEIAAVRRLLNLD